MSMKTRIFLLILFLFGFLAPPYAFACDPYIGSPWYTTSYEIDPQSLPSDIQVTYQTYPVLTNIGEKTYEILQRDRYEYNVGGYPTGYIPVYRLAQGKTERFNTYTKDWENVEQAIINSDSLSDDIPHYFKNGNGRPDHPVPGPITLFSYFYNENKIINIPVQVHYELNPNYDPYLEKRPDVMCGARFIDTPVLSHIIYFFTMTWGLVHSSLTRDIIAYDLSQNDSHAYFFFGTWGAIFATIFTYFLKKIRKN